MRTTTRRLLLATLLVVWVGLILACGGLGRPEVENKLAKADDQWKHGDKASAVKDYKLLYDEGQTRTAEKASLLPRIVEAEMRAGNTNEAKAWIKRGLRDKLNYVDYTDPAAKELFTVAKKEYEAEEASREAEEARKRAEAAARETRLNPVNVQKYHKIESGMTYDDVRTIIGVGGEELSRVELAGITTVIVAWSNRNGSNMNVTFQNGRVIAKAQFGLPYASQRESGPPDKGKAATEDAAERKAKAAAEDAAERKAKAAKELDLLRKIGEEDKRKVEEARRKAEAEATAEEQRRVEEQRRRDAEARKKAEEEAEAKSRAAEQRKKNEERAGPQLKYAVRLYYSGEKAKAIGRLESIIKDFPDTDAAQEAKDRLKDWKK